MNLNTSNYGHYRTTDYGRGGNCQLFNRKTDEVFDISQKHYRMIRNEEHCALVELIYKR